MLITACIAPGRIQQKTNTVSLSADTGLLHHPMRSPLKTLSSISSGLKIENDVTATDIDAAIIF